MKHLLELIQIDRNVRNSGPSSVAPPIVPVEWISKLRL